MKIADCSDVTKLLLLQNVNEEGKKYKMRLKQLIVAISSVSIYTILSSFNHSCWAHATQEERNAQKPN